MNNNIFFKTLPALAALFLLSACTQDEPGSPSGDVEGAYPLQIGSVTMSVESSERPWTRVSENADGSSSAWTPGEEFSVKFDDYDDIGTYRIKGDGTVEAVKPLYWKSTTQTSNITAWYTTPSATATDGTVNLSYQSAGLVYVLQATASSISYKSTVNLEFEHQLAKLRVVTKGTYDLTNATISVSAPASCAVNQGSVTVGASGTITMHKTIYDGIGTCWEANVPNGTTINSFTIEDNNKTATCTTTDISMTAAQISTATLTVNSEGTTTIDLSTGDYNINRNGTYYFSGTGSHAIKVMGGNPNIYLEDAQISVSSGNAIDITGGNPTIHIKGNDNEVSSSGGAGIYVAGSSTVTITGNSRDDALTTRGGNGGSGIGGNHATCGNIEISNMTVHAHGSDENGEFLSAGIGGSGNNGCGTITIDNATISAYGASDGAAGNMSTPGIGGGLDGNMKGTYSTITIKNNSQVSVQRGSSRSDYIGSGGSTMNPASSSDGIDATVDETSTITPLN